MQSYVVCLSVLTRLFELSVCAPHTHVLVVYVGNGTIAFNPRKKNRSMVQIPIAVRSTLVLDPETFRFIFGREPHTKR